jgi:hypothetical protein
LLRPERTRDQLLGKTLWTEFPELRGSTVDGEFHRAVAKQIPVTFEAFYSPLDIWLEVRAHPSAEGLSFSFRDITERRRDEERRAATFDAIRVPGR